jgi:hypothetical protein
MPYRKIDVSEYIGKKYGRLTIVGRSLIEGKKGKGSVWDCICDCGKKTQVSSSHLFDSPYVGKSRSCGCLHAERSRRFRNPGESGAIRVFKAYKSNALRRKLSFELSFEEFKNLTSGNCCYCGALPYQVSVVPHSRSHYSSYKYNGLDRIDSSQGYSLKNVVSCCLICNTMKWVLTKDDFFRQIAIIYNRNKIEIDSLGGLPNYGLQQVRTHPKLLIFKSKISDEKTESIFYSKKVIARVRFLNKHYILTTCGDYVFHYTQFNGRIHQCNEFSRILTQWTDQDIQNMKSLGNFSSWGDFAIQIKTWDGETCSSNIFPLKVNFYDEALKKFLNFLEKLLGPIKKDKSHW